MNSSKKCRLVSMMALTATFFFVEVIVGCMTNSTVLTADSFHMLTDIGALLISFISAKMSTKKWKRNTYGWARAEVLGALINTVFLIAMCVTIVIEACKHFSKGGQVHEPESLLVVGALGLVVNLVGLCLLYKHGMGHHGHSHGMKQNKLRRVYMASHSIEDNNGVEIVDLNKDKKKKKQKLFIRKSNHVQCQDDGDLNMRGAFLHVLNDALGSVIVVISALVIWKTTWTYRFYLDPVLSFVLVCLILRPAWPLLRESSLILLQSVPGHINVDELRKRLLEVEGILNVHEFHVWQLAGDRIIATAHIHCKNLMDYMTTAERVKEFFHNEGIHSTTIQPEFFPTEEIFDSAPEFSGMGRDFCALSCPDIGDDDCFKATCCQIKHKKLRKLAASRNSSSILHQMSEESTASNFSTGSMIEFVFIGSNPKRDSNENV